MKFLSVIAPFVIYAALAEAGKPKKPKFGGGHEEEDESSAQEHQAEDTATGFFAQTTDGPRDV